MLAELYQKEADEKFVMLPKCEMIQDYKPLDMYNLTIIKAQKGQLFDFVHTGVNMLLSQQCMSTKNNSSKLNTRESLLRLLDRGFIEIYEDANCTVVPDDIKPANAYFIKTTDKSDKSLSNGKEMYAKVFFEDLKKIMAIESNYKSHLFSVYHAVIGCIKYDKVDENGKIAVQQTDRLAYPSIETIAERTGLNRKTVINCLKTLYENEVLYSMTVRVNNKKERNFYCRWMYKDLIKEWIDKQLGNSEYEHLIIEGVLD